jgi:hypothetical protein
LLQTRQFERRVAELPPLGMNTLCIFTWRELRWPLIVAAVLALGVGLFVGLRRSTPYPFGPAVNHKSGVEYIGLIYKNGTQCGAFSVTNGYPDPMLFMLWNVESSRSNGWAPLLRTVPIPERLPARGFSAALGVQGYINPGATALFLVPQPTEAGDWRARVLVSRGLRGFQWRDRVNLLLHGSIKSALIPDQFQRTNYFRFDHIGLVDSPIVRWLPNKTLQGTPEPRSASVLTLGARRP